MFSLLANLKTVPLKDVSTGSLVRLTVHGDPQSPVLVVTGGVQVAGRLLMPLSGENAFDARHVPTESGYVLVNDCAPLSIEIPESAEPSVGAYDPGTLLVTPQGCYVVAMLLFGHMQKTIIVVSLTENKAMDNVHRSDAVFYRRWNLTCFDQQTNRRVVIAEVNAEAIQ